MFESDIIKFLGKTIIIKRGTPLHSTEYSMGFSDISNLEITINKTMALEAQEETILHELIHFIFDSNAIDTTETIVSVLSNCLYSILKGNNIGNIQRRNTK